MLLGSSQIDWFTLEPGWQMHLIAFKPFEILAEVVGQDQASFEALPKYKACQKT